jgi:hypothetical protein
MGTARPTDGVDGGKTVSSTAAPKIPVFSWQYIANPTAALGALMAAINAFPVAHYFGVEIGLLWGAPAVALLLLLVVYTVRTNVGDATARPMATIIHAVLVALWMVSAVALWSTGSPAAWVIAITICASWSIHIIFSGQGDLRVTLGLLALCTLPLLGFMLQAAWGEYPVWIAIPVSISAFCMVMSIASAGQYSNRNFQALQAAMAQTSATKSRLEFAIESVGDGYFEFDLETGAFSPNNKLATKLGHAGGQARVDLGS